MARYINLANASRVDSEQHLPQREAGQHPDRRRCGRYHLELVGGYWGSGSGWTRPTVGGPAATADPGHYNPPCTAVKVTATQHVPQIFVGGTGVGHAHLHRSHHPRRRLLRRLVPLLVQLPAVGVLNDILRPSARLRPGGKQRRRARQQLRDAPAADHRFGGSAHCTEYPHHRLRRPSGSPSYRRRGHPKGCGELRRHTGAFPLHGVQRVGDAHFGGPPVQLCQLVSVNGSSCGGSVPLNRTFDQSRRAPDADHRGRAGQRVTTPVDVQSGPGHDGCHVLHLQPDPGPTARDRIRRSPG